MHIYVIFDFILIDSALNVVTAWPSRIAFLGFGFFIFMTVATYCANLAGARLLLQHPILSTQACVELSDGNDLTAFMVMKPSSSGYIKKLSDVQAMSGAKICLLEAMSGMCFVRENCASIFQCFYCCHKMRRQRAGYRARCPCGRLRMRLGVRVGVT